MIEYQQFGGETRHTATLTSRRYRAYDIERGVPVDQFEVWRDGAGPWVAWCMDTINAATIERRTAFARALNEVAK
jgi:hypothetical protein